MNFRRLHQPAVVLILLVLASGVRSFSVPSGKADESNKLNPGETTTHPNPLRTLHRFLNFLLSLHCLLENAFEDANDQNKYNYNLTDAELLRTDERVDFYGTVPVFVSRSADSD